MSAIMKDEVSHAEQNAASWYGSIVKLVAALGVDYDRLEELRGERQALADEADGGSGAQQEALNIWDGDNAEELRELTEAATIDGDIQTDADAARDRLQEGPLSVEVRSGWYALGGDSTPEEFNILLSTGGPALRLMGDLDEHGEPIRAYLQYQDWGTPWTDYYAGEGSGAVLLAYAQQFYFGEG